MRIAPFPNPDWWEQNETDKQEFYGYDHGDGTTSWYTSDGCLDCTTSTPNENCISDEAKIYNGSLKRL